ncbi:MAG TPA: hypothetical protein VGP32_05120 [Steroidobacteraceae bacterium]|jgi:hypothetical protein|nr:hypothetical protein [Steroidobacteraceae bacterium]
MKSFWRLAACAALAAVSGNALAVGALADVTIIDRDSGAALATYYSNGEYWVAGRPGAHYAIEIRNGIGGRLLAVTSVDGINVLSGATAGWDQAGYVFDPDEQYQITGWRKSHAEVAAFTFTDASHSYAERTGRPANVGVIGVALFRERAPQRVYEPPRAPSATPGPPAPLTGQSPPAPLAALPPSGAAGSTAGTAGGAMAESRASDSLTNSAARLGTGHGEREWSYVVDTEFRRMQREPNEVIRIRYDSLESLVAMGIVRPVRPSSPAPNPFPHSHERQFVPDPPG